MAGGRGIEVFSALGMRDATTIPSLSWAGRPRWHIGPGPWL